MLEKHSHKNTIRDLRFITAVNETQSLINDLLEREFYTIKTVFYYKKDGTMKSATYVYINMLKDYYCR